jgi:hypothetical protein
MTVAVMCSDPALMGRQKGEGAVYRIIFGLVLLLTVTTARAAEPAPAPDFDRLVPPPKFTPPKELDLKPAYPKNPYLQWWEDFKQAPVKALLIAALGIGVWVLIEILTGRLNFKETVTGRLNVQVESPNPADPAGLNKVIDDATEAIRRDPKAMDELGEMGGPAAGIFTADPSRARWSRRFAPSAGPANSG